MKETLLFGIFMLLSAFGASAQGMTPNDLVGNWTLHPAKRFAGSVDWQAYSSGGVRIRARALDLSTTYRTIQFLADGTAVHQETPVRRIIETYQLGPVFNGIFQELIIGVDTYVIFPLGDGRIGILELQASTDDFTEVYSTAGELMMLKKVEY